ncbi:MAG: hypothetical protein ACRCV9_00185 [Burkholderiaceae bacterium]
MSAVHLDDPLSCDASRMWRDAFEVPHILATQFVRNAALLQMLGALLRDARPADLCGLDPDTARHLSKITRTL